MVYYVLTYASRRIVSKLLGANLPLTTNCGCPPKDPHLSPFQTVRMSRHALAKGWQNPTRPTNPTWLTRL